MLEHLLKIAPDRYDITIFNAEPRVNYNRIMLSPVLSGEKTIDEIVINAEAGTPSMASRCCTGASVVAIDREQAAWCIADDGAKPSLYDKLVIATGSNPVHHSGSRPRPAGRPRLPRSRRRQRDDGGRQAGPSTPW